MNKIISILTATRAEYGLLKPIIKKLNQLEGIDVRIVVTGMHLSQNFGFTYKEIEADGFAIDKKIEILLNSDTQAAVSKSMGLAMISFADYFETLKPDLLMVLGDRYETLAVCIAAMNARIPIAHLYGGEITEGVIDDCIRHAVTKLSYIHFTSTAAYRNRVIQLGEEPERVFQVGAIGIENIKNTKLMSKTELEESLNFPLEKPFAVVTFHPVTLEDDEVEYQFDQLLKACNMHTELNYIFTKANSDAHGLVINRKIDEYGNSHENAAVFSSLGTLRYLSALKYCAAVIGNSSSGLLEAPSFGIPTINIGDRQKGRLQSDSVINCIPETKAIDAAISQVLQEEFKQQIKYVNNPYGDGNTSDKIVKVVENYLFHQKIDLKKRFFDK